MTLFECIDLANLCGLETLGEAEYNVVIHAGSLFPYDEIQREIDELEREITELDYPDMDIPLWIVLNDINKRDGTNLKFEEIPFENYKVREEDYI